MAGVPYVPSRRKKSDLTFGDYSMPGTPRRGNRGMGTSAEAGETTVPKVNAGKSRFAGTSSGYISGPKAPEKGKMGTEYVPPKKKLDMAPAPVKMTKPKAPAPKAAPKKDYDAEYRKSRDQLGAFYLNAAGGYGSDWFSGKRKK